MGTHRKPIPVEVLSRITKFYVSNLPERCSGADLAKEVRNFGTIFDIYIARKRDKIGRRFGFISLFDVKDRREMERVLSSIRLGDYKLKVNVARFVLEEGEVDVRKKYVPKNQQAQTSQGGKDIGNTKDGPWNGLSSNAMSYKEAFTGVAEGKTLVVEDTVCAFEDLHGRSVVVRVASLVVLRRIKDILKEMGLGEGIVNCLGGLMVLITFDSKDHAMMAKDELLGRPEVFSSAVIWEGQELQFERVAWLKVLGIPLCILDDRVIENIGSFFGMVVRKPAVDCLELDASFQYIGVVVGQGARIQSDMFLKWRGKTFKIWVEEDEKEWLSSFIAQNDDGESQVKDDRSSSSMEVPDAIPAKVFLEEEVFTGVVKEEVNAQINVGITEEVFSVEKMEGGLGGVNAEDSLTQSLPMRKNKRKKDKKKQVGVGQGSGGSYLSSNDRSNKGPKTDDDPFDLEPIILGMDSKVVKTRGSASVTLANSFQALVGDIEDFRKDGVAEQVDGKMEEAPNISLPNEVSHSTEELEATVEFGGRLGVQLQGFETLIADTIEGEGLQKGLR
ncbi:hypothetical protein SSX86_006710 [Deinandra increscens subsp. villosa]|uniref:RRM domain-containing protein n=1 Tax=Deinandra increscens subsp. villosa TaxID=3103831 RepID=A0AAP0H414_9ASTR